MEDFIPDVTIVTVLFLSMDPVCISAANSQAVGPPPMIRIDFADWFALHIIANSAFSSSGVLYENLNGEV
jgi:hypothetical protein